MGRGGWIDRMAAEMDTVRQELEATRLALRQEKGRTSRLAMAIIGIEDGIDGTCPWCGEMYRDGDPLQGHEASCVVVLAKACR